MTFWPMIPTWAVSLLGAGLLVTGWFALRRPGERKAWVIRMLMVLCVLGVLVRPGVGQAPASTQSSDLEVLVVVDRTTSMAAQDWDGGDPRLDGVRADLAEITRSMPGSRFSLVTFGRFTRTELPFSSDTDAFRSVMETLRPEGSLDGSGSRVDAPLEQMTETLTSAEEERPDRRRIVLFLSDGENTVQDPPQESFAQLEELVDDGLVLGYGTEEGGKMPYDVEEPGEGYIKDENYDDAVSRLDEDNLRTLAEEMGIDYRQRTAPGDLEDWASGLERSFSDDGAETRAAHELFWVPGLVLFGLALLELWFAWRGLLAARREVKDL